MKASKAQAAIASSGASPDGAPANKQFSTKLKAGFPGLYSAAETASVLPRPVSLGAMGDRIALMRRGRLVQHGPAAELYNDPVDLFAARFFSEVNQVEGRVTSAGVETPLGVVKSNGAAQNEKVDVCIRPQGICLNKAGLCGVPGRIVSKRFVGEVDLLSIVIDGLDHPLKARVRAGSAWEPGMDVAVDADPKDVLVFSRKESQV